ncbi:ATP-binding protein, partial [Aerosakkonema funiforme]|uniref:ATP-binding protein n=1 Tax=Aerosakkonema funiforme TaxID=1246630 RepID=UPI0035B7B809
LTGELPFQSNEPMELVHCHIAKQPKLVHEINPDIPAVLSEIVSKLMAKNAEDRYQSALGLKWDLEQCWQQLQTKGCIEAFTIAQRDLCDRFIIPDKLYGREAEVSTLLEAFERVSHGATEMMLVAGFSGIGKTAVVNEVHKPIVRQRGYFIKGKYDQFQRNIPFSAFVQAFRDLMGQLLTASDAQIQEWKNQILEAVGENGQVIIEVIPELENIIGPQPPAVELSGTAAQNRFNLLFQKFTQVFTTKEHPLVMFLDDLQWADSASLKLMQLLMADTGYLFIIGAYRDNEVPPGHPLLITLSEIQNTQAIINTITLAPLSQVKVNQLVADTLKCPEELAWSLSRLISQKTQGNPFFATQFLKALHQDGLIQFDFELGCWQCDISLVRVQAVTDDVVAFMSLQLRKLPSSTQEVLRLAACIGNSFDLATLAIVAEQSQIEAAACLWRALQEGLIVPIGDVYKFYLAQETQVPTSEKQQNVNYKFLHDRVQQAAYSLIPDDQKQRTHLKIGRLLLRNSNVQTLETHIFDIANHWNEALDLILANKSEKIELVHINILAGRKAKNSIAYKSALDYLKIAIFLLPSDIWNSQYNLALDLYNLAGDTAYLSGDFVLMEQWLSVLLAQATNVLDRIGAYQTKIQAYTAQTKQQEVIQLALQVLEILGVPCSEKPDEKEVEQAFKALQNNLAHHSIEALSQLPRMTDKKWLAVIQILQAAIPTVYQVNAALFQMMVFKLIDLSLEYGNTPFSAFGYACYGLLLCGINQVEAGHQFGCLASILAEKFGDRGIQVKTLFCVNVYINIWKQHINDVIDSLQKVYQLAREQGEIEFSGYSIFHYLSCSYLSGISLNSLKRKITDCLEILKNLKQDSVVNWTQCYFESILLLLQERSASILNTQSDLAEIVDDLNQKQDFHGLFHAYLNQGILFYLMGYISQSRDALNCAEKYLDTVTASISIPVFTFYDSLVKFTFYSNGDIPNQSVMLEILGNNKSRMEEWAIKAPNNYQHKYCLLEAEYCRILGKSYQAMEWYDRAISLAKSNGYIQEEALANELAAKFYLGYGKEKIAAGYMQEAYYCYARWGAKAKVADLEQRYPQLLAPILQQNRSVLSIDENTFTLGALTLTATATYSSTSVFNTLDLKAILKASQTISSEIELEKLLSSLLSIIIENAGADKCVLMLLRDDSLLIKGSIIQGKNSALLQRIPVEESQDIPHKLIYKVKHSQQTVVLLDATADTTLANDLYIIHQQPQSILCSPILHQGKLLGILYLENNLTKGAFTSDRIELLNLLCAQAAISLENALLYQRSLEYAQELHRSLHELKIAQTRFYNLVDNVPGVVYQFLMATDGSVSMPYISSDCYALYEVTASEAIANVQI